MIRNKRRGFIEESAGRLNLRLYRLIYACGSAAAQCGKALPALPYRASPKLPEATPPFRRTRHLAS
jgi:hypothetical protein